MSSIRSARLLRDSRRPWALLTAYDAPTARLLASEGVDAILVGDSVGTVLLGYDSTRRVTVDDLDHHLKAVVRGAGSVPVIADLPYAAVRGGPAAAVAAARRFVRSGAVAVKVEWHSGVLRTLSALESARISFIGHTGLEPQSVKPGGAFKVQGRDLQSSLEVLGRAIRFERSGAFAVLLECVSSPVARLIAGRLHVPVIGIGSGPFVAGQILVYQDVVGLSGEFKPRFVKRYADTGNRARKAVREFVAEVRSGKFPSPRFCYEADKELIRLVLSQIPAKKCARRRRQSDGPAHF